MPTPTTVSTSTVEMEEGKHVFDIVGYSRHRGMGHGAYSFVRSSAFSVGGHNWSIRVYPDGSHAENKDYISVHLELKRGKVRASCDLRLINQTTGLPSLVHRTENRMFNSRDDTRFAPQTRRVTKRSNLEASGYLKGDRLTIECIVTVFQEPLVCERKSGRKIQVPPSNILEHLGKMLKTGEGADVTFSVVGQTFEAHRFVLAMRSPVFKAELCGLMMEARTGSVTVRGMQPAVFEGLLHFIYTDSLPALDDLKGADRREMIRHLLVAGDRYGMDRLKVMCESMLHDDLNVQNVETTLALADRHHCRMLKDACIRFISSSTVDDVTTTKRFVDLIRNCPLVLVAFVAACVGVFVMMMKYLK